MSTPSHTPALPPYTLTTTITPFRTLLNTTITIPTLYTASTFPASHFLSLPLIPSPLEASTDLPNTSRIPRGQGHSPPPPTEASRLTSDLSRTS
ncbi:hypothetical protein E2C01_095718 [Portunus trituberculatus]|uniref:Uncharacterized protein n=1 Tax=Portunus trituberculatus TaxID=210409 RepID=A0A5B7K4R6_PORTR|nr:hypothetical protein [Portunus trituberculatus]